MFASFSIGDGHHAISESASIYCRPSAGPLIAGSGPLIDILVLLSIYARSDGGDDVTFRQYVEIRWPGSNIHCVGLFLWAETGTRGIRQPVCYEEVRNGYPSLPCIIHWVRALQLCAIE